MRRITVVILAVLLCSVVVTDAQAFRPGQIHYMKRIVRPYTYKLDRMAMCESHQNWYINTGNGFYGGLQFDLQTWHGVGGWGYPHQHSKLEQKYRAVKLIWRRGYGPWPICGYR